MYTESNNTANPNAANGATNEQLMMLLKLQGSAAQVLANYVNESANKKKKMEEADILRHVEECRRREDMMMVLVKNTTTMYLPTLFGVGDSNFGVYVNLSSRAPLRLRAINAEGEDASTLHDEAEASSMVRCGTGSLVQEVGPIPPCSWEQYNRISTKKIATLLLANNNPMFSLSSEINPYPDQCLREVLPGASMIVVQTFELLCQTADTLLTETLVQSCIAKMDNGANSGNGELNVTDVRAGLRSMDKGSTS